MLKKTVTFLLFTLPIYADMLSFYKDALQTLQYEKSYNLYKQSNKITQDGVTYSKYANFSMKSGYKREHAQSLPLTPGSFNTIDIFLSDSIDLFGKSNYKIESLHLDKKVAKAQLNIKKEQLFIALVNLITLYNRTSQELQLYQRFFTEQETIYKSLKLLDGHGDITKLDLLRFKNTLTALKTKIVSQKQIVVKMQKQLRLYTRIEAIPTLAITELLYSKDDFMAHNPQDALNSLNVQKRITQAKGMNNSYLPTFSTNLAYQKVGDPTGSGDNYSLGFTLNMPLNSGNFKKAEALEVSALSLQTQQVTFKIQRENLYIQHKQSYENASEQSIILKKALRDYQESEKTIKIAYLKKYVDFNTYLQVLKQALNVKKQIIAMRIQKAKEATIINAIASGKIYE